VLVIPTGAASIATSNSNINFLNLISLLFEGYKGVSEGQK